MRPLVSKYGPWKVFDVGMRVIGYPPWCITDNSEKTVVEQELQELERNGKILDPNARHEP